ncbi:MULTISPECIES: hypothetical protein [Providencia]|uniref:Uncharacterized protein n=1 Tax=Providencia rettgeri TaxID=587 RepID=A0AB35L9J3_PRORE|nr:MULTISPECIES: hypothetical protein [Providencia]AXH61730.1 hypothetical protein CYG50_06665 [Providencia huaxiensis]MDH2304805.1 hypothetical protein [Providencia rettgeri]
MKNEQGIEKNNAHISNELAVEVYRIGYESGLQVVKMLFLSNGGAVIALLALFGNVWNKSIPSEILMIFADSMLYFCVGLTLAIVTTAFAYINNILQGFISNIKISVTLLICMCLFGLSSAVFLILGIFKSYSAMSIYFS